MNAIEPKQSGRSQKQKTCYNCGRIHRFKPKSNSPAYGSTCHKCGKDNHWKSVCRSGKSQQRRPRSKSPRRRVHYVYEDEDSPDEFLTIGTIDINSIADSSNDTRAEVFATLCIKQKGRRPLKLRCKVDTGAQTNILPVHLFRIIFPEKLDSEGNQKPECLKQNKMALTAYGGSKIAQLGTDKIPCAYKDSKYNCIFYVTDAAGPAILGLQTCQALNLITLHCSVETKPVTEQTPNPPEQINKDNPRSSSDHEAHFADQTTPNPKNKSHMYMYVSSDTPLEMIPPIHNKAALLEMYPDCFDDTVGCFENFKYHICIDPDAKPVIYMHHVESP